MLGMTLIDLPLSELVVVSKFVDNLCHCRGARCVLFDLGISEPLLQLVFLVVVLQFLQFVFSIVSKGFEIIISFLMHASFSAWICSWYNTWEFNSVSSDFALKLSSSRLKILSTVFCSSVIISFLKFCNELIGFTELIAWQTNFLRHKFKEYQWKC